MVVIQLQKQKLGFRLQLAERKCQKFTASVMVNGNSHMAAKTENAYIYVRKYDR